MILEPPIEELSEMVGDKYKLCVLASKRALEIQKANLEDHVNPEITDITQAAQEIYDKKVKSNI